MEMVQHGYKSTEHQRQNMWFGSEPRRDHVSPFTVSKIKIPLHAEIISAIF